MKLSNLKKTRDSDFRNYLKEKYELTHYQWEKMYYDEFPRFTKYEIYEEEKQKNGGFLWRLTLPLIIPYQLIMVVFILGKWIITGNRYMKESQLKPHRFWMKKLGIDWM